MLLTQKSIASSLVHRYCSKGMEKFLVSTKLPFSYWNGRVHMQNKELKAGWKNLYANTA